MQLIGVMASAVSLHLPACAPKLSHRIDQDGICCIWVVVRTLDGEGRARKDLESNVRMDLECPRRVGSSVVPTALDVEACEWNGTFVVG